MQNIFFFQTKQIHDNTNLFDQLKKQNIFYSYFQVDQNYYLFIFSQKSIDINLFYQSVKIIEELDSKQRKIRSLRGFFLYALETMEKGKEYEILETNLQPFFWRKIKNIIRQNKKAALQEFLSLEDTDKQHDNKGSNPKIQLLENQIQNLQNQVNSLQQKVIQLEDRVQHNSKDLLSDPTQPLEPSKITQQANYTLNSNMGSVRKKSFQENDTNFHQAQEASLNSLSEDSRIHFKNDQTTQEYNITSNQDKDQNRGNFITLGRIPEQERIEIIQTGFQLQAKGTISLKKYYEGTDTYSLFQLKGYSIKYEAIRKNKLYQTLKE